MYIQYIHACQIMSRGVCSQNPCFTKEVFACHSHLLCHAIYSCYCYAMLSLSVASFSLHGRNAVMHENLGSRQLNPTKPRYGTQMHAVCLLLPPKKHMQRLPNVSKLHKRFQCLRNARIRANQMHLAIWSFFHT